MKKWSPLNTILTEAQFGFRADQGRADARAILQALLDSYEPRQASIWGIHRQRRTLYLVIRYGTF